ncbi:MAG: hypothetical protein P8Y23_00360 [Candidatus Lokiarchaeota archaeon]|jgi:hypothetical protein
MKTVNVVNSDDVKKKVSDVEIFGNPDTFQLICKASSKNEGWMKSTKAMEVPGRGCIIQVSTQQGDNVAEAICFVPDVVILVDDSGNKKIVKR